jgi:hypothetical protein
MVEILLSEEVAALAWALGRRELDDAVARFANEGRPELTRLRTELDGVDPDIAFSISCSSQVAQPCSAPRSTRLQIIEELAGAPPPDSVASKWRPIEWQLYLESLPSDVIVEDLAALDSAFISPRRATMTFWRSG